MFFGKTRYFNPLVISFMLLIIFFGTRKALGIDDKMYEITFDQINQYGYSWRDIEFSYVWISKLVQSINGNIQLVYLIYAVLAFSFLYMAINKLLSREESIVFFVIFFITALYSSMTLMRQFTSVGLLLMAYVKMKSKKRKGAVIYYILAVIIHYTSAVGLLYYFMLPFIRKIKYSSKVLILGISFLFQFIPMVNVLHNFFSNTSFENTYYIKYYLGFQSEQKLFNDPIGILEMILLGIYIYLLYNQSKKQNVVAENKFQSDMEDFTFIYFVFRMLLAQFGYLNRITYCISFCMMIYLCQIIYIFKMKDRKTLKFIVMVVSLLIFLYATNSYVDSSGVNHLIPYSYNFKFFN